MKLGVRGKLFVVSLALVLVVGGVSGIYLEGALRSALSDRMETDLLHDAYAMRDLMEVAPQADSIATVDALADRLSRSTDARITIVDGAGVVLGDSDLSNSGIVAAPNHGLRPEIIAARHYGKGSSRRFSTTVGADMLYVAVPYDNGAGVVRAAMPLSEVDAAVSSLRMLLLLTGALGLVLAVLMSGLASHLMTRALRRLVTSARQLAVEHGGELVPVPSSDELGGLAGSFNQVAKELSATVSALAQERDRLHRILDSMGEAVLALDAEQRVTLVNATARDWLGLGEDANQKTLLEVSRLPALVGVLKEAEKGGAAAEFELPGPPPRRVLVQAAMLRASPGAVVVMHDVTKRRRMETVRSDFVANVSHELRTPVSVIRANAETLLDAHPFDDPEEREFLAAIFRNAERLSHLISDLLDLSRIEAGEQAFHPGPTTLASVVERASGAASGQAGQKSIAVTHSVDADVRVHTDERALEQVLQNLLDNAVKYTQVGGHVTVRAVQGPHDATDGDRIRVEIEDDGPGIDESHRDRVFERFYRVDTGRSREVGGTGLGLAIVKHLVQAMAGTVGVRPGASGGSIFWIELPRE